MNQIATVALASLASLASAAATHAATYGGFTVSAGTPRVVTTVSQTSTPVSNATSRLRVERCSGVIEYPAFVVISPSTVIATGPDYRVVMTNVGATLTSITIEATAATCGLKAVSFGTPNTKCGYDLRNPNPGTAGSSTGADPVPAAMGGAWTTFIHFDNVVKYPTAPAAGDLYGRMTVYFSSCFDAGDVWTFHVDTDRIG
jgi:hypothetical protein